MAVVAQTLTFSSSSLLFFRFSIRFLVQTFTFPQPNTVKAGYPLSASWQLCFYVCFFFFSPESLVIIRGKVIIIGATLPKQNSPFLSFFYNKLLLFLFFYIYLEFIWIKIYIWHEVSMNFFSQIIELKFLKLFFLSNFNYSFTIFWCLLIVFCRALEFLRLASGRQLWLYFSLVTY